MSGFRRLLTCEVDDAVGAGFVLLGVSVFDHVLTQAECTDVPFFFHRQAREKGLEAEFLKIERRFLAVLDGLAAGGVTLVRHPARLKVLLAQRNTPGAGLRVAVRGGGCSGLAYVIEWAEAPKERDKIFEKDGIRVFVDPKSYLYLMGSELRYEETLMASGFKLENPNVKTACGCGESFTV